MKNIVKKISLFITSLLLICLLSCASTPSTTNEPEETPAVDEKIEEVVEVEEETVEIEVVEEIVITPEEEYLTAIENVTLQFVEVPKETTVSKDFASAYKIAVTNNGEPLADYQIQISYPSEKSSDGFVFTTETVTTDSEGFYTYTPAKPAFAAWSKVYASLYTELSAEEVVAAVEAKKVSADYKVKSNTINKGCLLFVWEYNEKDRATNNFNDLQSALRRKNISLCGNAPINDKSDISKSLKTLYKENYEIVEDMYGYLIVGTVKFTQPVALVEDESGYLCSLVAEISAINMKNGAKVFEQSFTHETIGSNWTKATTACKTALADKIVEALVYGL